MAVEVGWLTAQYLLSQLPVLQEGLYGVAKLLVDGVDAENLNYLPSYVVKIVATQTWDHMLGMATLLVYFWLVLVG